MSNLNEADVPYFFYKGYDVRPNYEDDDAEWVVCKPNSIVVFLCQDWKAMIDHLVDAENFENLFPQEGEARD